MKLQGKMWATGVCLALLSVLAVCDTAAARPPGRGIFVRSGPPAHAPAYGYRNKQVYGFELVFDVGVGMYVAVGMTDVYYHEGYFYRLRGGAWEISLRGVTWGPVVIEKLPPGLQIKAKSLIKLNGNGPNDNAAGNAGKSNGPADTNANKPTGAADATAGKANGTAANGATKPAASADKPGGTSDGKSGGNTAGSVTKPSGNSDSSAAKPSAGSDGSRKTKSGGKGKKK